MFPQLLIAAFVGLALAAPSDKVDAQLKPVLASNGRANVVVSFNQDTGAVLNRINGMKFASREAKITTVRAKLVKLQTSTQKNAVSLLSGSSVTFHSLWINNRIYIEDATTEIVSAIAALPEVSEVREEIVVPIVEPIEFVQSHQNTNDPEWGIIKMEVEQAWMLPGGNNGAGVVVSIIDTGVRWTHQALRNNYRSSYGWYDPYTGTSSPIDENGHGTHVMGSIIGAGGIGVAPGAQWIACRGCDTGSCSESALSRCGQWIACPTLANGTSPVCSMAPALVSNSWAGGQGDTWYDSVISGWHTLGIIPVFGQGNGGPDCETANSPGDRPNVIGVGATTISDNIAYFSSRGPSVDGHLKPDVSAPGMDIRSAWIDHDMSYRTASGTSMATPHVSGVVALLVSRNPTLEYEQVKDLLQTNADRELGNATTCGESSEWPNNVYGHGRINARKALEAAIDGF